MALLDYLNSTTNKCKIKIEVAAKRMIKSSPIYTTESFVTLIRSAKITGHPFLVKEIS